MSRADPSREVRVYRTPLDSQQLIALTCARNNLSANSFVLVSLCFVFLLLLAVPRLSPSYVLQPPRVTVTDANS